MALQRLNRPVGEFFRIDWASPPLHNELTAGLCPIGYVQERGGLGLFDDDRQFAGLGVHGANVETLA